MENNRFTSGLINEPVLPRMLRFIAYSLVITLFAFSLPMLVRYGVEAIFGENGPLEWVHVGLLLGASMIFLSTTTAASDFRELLIILASVSGFAAIRELDGLLDVWLPWISWKFSFILILYAVYLGCANRDKFRWQFAHFMSTSAFSVLWGGFIVAMPVAQLFGHGPFLQELMGDDYQRFYKCVIEESGEFVGYLMLLAGSIETRIQMKALQGRLR
ncbi:hypothetical protein Metal_0534 [Methylomicrobium album BG8]|uniref:Uncharacterized protein n=2 Tax=Methylococcaceae TaxID=403 RepID=H8GNW2_METAL|nr:hypothetical protein Metal_0534 [Methylomicrobium album BG8]